MRRSVALLALLACASCATQDEPARTTPAAPTEVAQEPAVADRRPAVSEAPWTFSGPGARADYQPGQQWTLAVRDAGAGLHPVIAAYWDDTPGYEPTTEHAMVPRIAGPTDYAPHASGTTTVTLDPLRCGRVQLDIRFWTEVHDSVVNYGPGDCRPVPPPPATTTTTTTVPPGIPRIPTPEPTTTSVRPSTTSVKPDPRPCRHPREHRCPGPSACHSAQCAQDRCHG